MNHLSARLARLLASLLSSRRPPAGHRRRTGAGASAFSLIELLAVIAIIGILSVAALPFVQEFINRARVSKVLSQLRVIADAKQAYYAVNPDIDVGQEPAFNLLQRYIQSQGQQVTSLAEMEAGTGFQLVIGNFATPPTATTKNKDLALLYQEIQSTNNPGAPTPAASPVTTN